MPSELVFSVLVELLNKLSAIGKGVCVVLLVSRCQHLVSWLIAQQAGAGDRHISKQLFLSQIHDA